MGVSAIMMYSGYSEMVAPKEPEQPRNSRKVFVGAVVGALALLVVVFAIGQTQDDSVRNLLTATKAYAAPHKVKLAKLTYDTRPSTLPSFPVSKFKAPVGRQDFDGAQRRGLGQAPLHKTICLLI